jgi:hypothetical protein
MVYLSTTGGNIPRMSRRYPEDIPRMSQRLYSRDIYGLSMVYLWENVGV